MSYNGTVFSSIPAVNDLTFLEKAWSNLFHLGYSEAVTTGVIAFIWHEIIYFGRSLPFLIADFIPSFQKYKLQPKVENTGFDYWRCLLGVLYCHFFFELPLIFLFHPVAHFFGMKIATVPFPSYQEMVGQIAFFFLFEDFFHYWLHRFLHWGPMYKNIHKQHHEYSAPFGMVAEYAHPLETIILGMGTIGSPILWVIVTGDLHMITMLTWITLRLFQAIDAHSGYDFPWSLHNWIPFWSGAEHHDFHHQAFVNNYATSFRWWDYIFGTDTKYRAYRKRQREEKVMAAKGVKAE